MKPTVAELLILGWGNESRGDDALGPRCLEAVRAALPLAALEKVDFLDDYQLQVEFALDLVGRKQVLFVDASVECGPPFEIRQIQAQRDSSFSSHALSPQALLQVFVDMYGTAPPPSTVLAIRGTHFELGEPMSAHAESNLIAAKDWALNWIASNIKGSEAA
jgi:hydrogenase maturation protease